MAWRVISSLVLLAALVSCAQAAGARRRLAQSPPLSENYPNGASIDNNEGWSNNNAKGYSAVPNITCAAPLVDCNYNSTCYDLQTNILFCGSCLNSCDAFSQMRSGDACTRKPDFKVCSGGMCECRPGFTPCAAKGGRCLDTESCPGGGSTGNASDLNTQGSGGQADNDMLMG